METGRLPMMSFLICSVMGMGFTASGEMYLVKMVTASFSIPAKTTDKIQMSCLRKEKKGQSRSIHRLSV